MDINKFLSGESELIINLLTTKNGLFGTYETFTYLVKVKVLNGKLAFYQLSGETWHLLKNLKVSENGFYATVDNDTVEMEKFYFAIPELLSNKKLKLYQKLLSKGNHLKILNLFLKLFRTFLIFYSGRYEEPHWRVLKVYEPNQFSSYTDKDKLNKIKGSINTLNGEEYRLLKSLENIRNKRKKFSDKYEERIKYVKS